MSNCRIDEAMKSFNFNKVGVYALFSHSLKMYTVPFFCADDESAVRAIVDRVCTGQDSSLTFGVTSGDLRLFKLGDFTYSDLIPHVHTEIACNSDLLSRVLMLRPDFSKYIKRTTDFGEYFEGGVSDTGGEV